MPEEKVFPMEADNDDESDGDDLGSALSFQDFPGEEENLDPHHPIARESGNLDSDSTGPNKQSSSSKKSLLKFRCRVEDAILSNNILGKKKGRFQFPSNGQENLKEIPLWGVHLLTSKNHEGTDIVLMKFLKAEAFKVSEAFNSLRQTLKWQRKFKVEGILEEKMDSGLEKLAWFDSEDK